MQEKIADSIHKNVVFPARKWATVCLFLAGIAYFINFCLVPYVSCVSNGAQVCEWIWFSASTGTWGEFGDFFGGMLNPFMTFLTVILLVETIRQQNRAIEQSQDVINLTREEIKIARIEIAMSREIAKKTEEALNSQIGISTSQNNLTNFFQHRNQYEVYIDKSFGGDHGIATRQFHSLVYPLAKLGDLSVSIYWIEKLYEEICEDVSVIDNLNGNSAAVRNIFLDFLINQHSNRDLLFKGVYVFKVGRLELQSRSFLVREQWVDIKIVDIKAIFGLYCSNLMVFQKLLAFDADMLDLKFKLVIEMLIGVANNFPELADEELFPESRFEKFNKFKLLKIPEIRLELDCILTEINRRKNAPNYASDD